MRPTTRQAVRRRQEHADPSCKATYRWEDSWPDWEKETLTLAQCREVVRCACRVYGLDVPAVRQHKRGMAYSVTHTPPHGSHISFVPRHKNKPIALHEAAHHIAQRLFGTRIQDHGPKWRGIYFYLLANGDVAPLTALKASVRPFKLRWREIAP